MDSLTPDVQRYIEYRQDGPEGSADLRISQAVLSIQRAIQVKTRLRTHGRGEWHKKMWNQTYWVRAIVLILYMAVTLFELPPWCGSFRTDNNCKNNSHNAPMADLPKISYFTLHLIELFLLVLLLTSMLYRRTFYIPSRTSKLREILAIVSVVVSLLDNTASMILNVRVYLVHWMRPLVFLLFVRSVRESLKRIFCVLLETKWITVLIFLHILIFSLMAMILFQGTNEEEAYFSDLVEAGWNLLHLLSTVNFPDIMMMAYAQNRLNCLFFIAFVSIGTFILVNLILAIIYNGYRAQINRTAEEFVNHRTKYMLDSFDRLDISGDGHISKRTLQTLISHLKDELHLNMEDRSVLNLLISYTSLEKEEFMEIIDYLILKSKKENKNHVLMRVFPNFYTPDNSVYMYLYETLKNTVIIYLLTI